MTVIDRHSIKKKKKKRANKKQCENSKMCCHIYSALCSAGLLKSQL